MNRLIDKLFHAIDCFTGILTGLMVLFVFLNVVLRTFFNSGLTWSEELARYLFVYVTYIGAISAMHSNAHLGVDTLLSRVSPKVQLALYLVSRLLSCAFWFMGHLKWSCRIHSPGPQLLVFPIPCFTSEVS